VITIPGFGDHDERNTHIWRSDMGHLFVTLPAKPGKSGRYFDYLRPAKAGNGTVKALKEQILRQWEAVRAAETSVA
jgi:hypothetical protein